MYFRSLWYMLKHLIIIIQLQTTTDFDIMNEQLIQVTGVSVYNFVIDILYSKEFDIFKSANTLKQVYQVCFFVFKFCIRISN